MTEQHSSAGTVDAQELRLEWRVGAPTKPWSEEWFIAETIWGDRVVLRALPDERTYNFKTADDTYIKHDKIKRWMQFPDSEFIAPDVVSAPAQPSTATEEAYRVFPDDVEPVDYHPAGKITVDRGNLRYAFLVGAEWAKQANAPAQEAVDCGDDENRMEKISALIARLQKTLDQFGDTCVYIRRGGLSWGAVALNRRDDDQKHGVFDLQAQHDRDMEQRVGQVERLIADRNRWMQRAMAAEKASAAPITRAKHNCGLPRSPTAEPKP